MHAISQQLSPIPGCTGMDFLQADTFDLHCFQSLTGADIRREADGVFSFIFSLIKTSLHNEVGSTRKGVPTPGHHPLMYDSDGASTKKTMDSNINTIQRGLLDKIEVLSARVTSLEEENKKLEEERNAMKEECDLLKGKMESIKEREEGEIGHDLQDIRDELKKEWVETVKEEIKIELEAKQEGWVEVVKKRLRVEPKEEMTQEANKKEQALARFRIVNNTLEEEKMRQARRLNIKVSGLKETPGSTPEEDGRKLCAILGYKEEDPLPFVQAWRAGKDLTRERSLILHFGGEEARTTFMKKRVILRDLKEGDPIYLDEDLTKMQRDHRFSCMPQIRAARAAGKKATYRDGHVIINGKVIE